MKMGAGGATIGFGGVFIAGGSILLGNAKKDSDRNVSYILTGGGAVLCIIGGVVMGNAGREIARMQMGLTRLKFTGTAIVLNF